MKLNRQAEMKCELIAHMVVSGLPRAKIAQAMSMTYQGLDKILIRPDYQEIEDRIAGRTKRKLEEASGQRLEKRLALSGEVEDAVGEAVNLLLAALREKNDLKAALEILDREPRHQFAKASRSQQAAAAQSTISSAALADAVREADVTTKIMRSAETIDPERTFPKA